MTGRVLARQPLWLRLSAAVLLLVAVALTAVATVGVTVLRGQLLAQIDAQLGIVAASYPTPLFGAEAGAKPAGPAAGSSMLVQVQRRDAAGNLVGDGYQGDEDDGPPPAPAARVAIPADPAWLDEHRGDPVTVPASTGDASWRVLVRPLPAASGWVVFAVGLGELDGTIASLVRTNLVVGALVLVGLAIVSVVVVRASLRPLGRVERTAAAIAAGDLSRRVPEQPPGTEVGRLGRALNGMLAQIEAAFLARARSESTARRSEERMRRLVSDAGHELRTPLAVIRAWAEHATRGPRRDRAELVRILTTVGTEATRLSTLVDDLLLLARLDQQRPLDRVPVDLLALAVDAVRDARLLAPERDIRLSVDDRTTYVVTGDELRLRQVVTNLTSNALTHTPPGTPVSVTLGPADPPGDPTAVVLAVTDQGPGLTPEQAERVFERFYRTDTSRTRSTGGSGLGLAIVAALVTAHGGDVRVAAAPGSGARFSVTLPLADPVPGAPAPR